MDIRPQDLPELRAELAAFLGTRDPEAMKAVARTMGAGDIPDEWFSFHFQQLRLQHAGLTRSELFYVAPPMIELAAAAGASLPPFTLAPGDVPAPFGFMFFGAPLYLDDLPTDEPTWAASWRPNMPGGLHIDWYNDREVLAGAADDTNPQMASALRTGPILQALTSTQVPYGGNGEYGEAHRGEPLGDARKPWLNTLKATWLLMQQPLASVTTYEPDRAARKRLRRAGQEPGPVRVIELRRPKTSSSHSDGDREYHHQWIVRGHWRNHWHPKRQVHRPVWIAPHIKGPEGAPLIGGEKVYALKR